MNHSDFDPKWIADAQNGDQDAITQLYNTSYREVYLLIRSMIRGDEDTVLDLVQDSYIKAFQRLAQLKDPAKYHGWIRQIARNTALDHLKKSKAILFTELSGNEEEPFLYEPEDENIDHIPEAALDRQETVRLLREILDSLPEGQRAVVSLHFYQDLSVKEIASVMGKSAGTIKAQLRYARENIRRKLQELERKDGVKLYSISPVSFLLYLLRSLGSFDILPNASILGDILQSIGIGAGAAAGAAAGTAANAAGAAVKAAGNAIAKKAAAAILAATVLTGGAVAAYTVAANKPDDPATVDLFEDYKVTFSGFDGEGVACVHNIDGYSLDYDVEPGYDLSNGDTVVLTLTAPNGDDLEDYCSEHYGFIPTSDSQEYIVSGLEEAD